MAKSQTQRILKTQKEDTRTQKLMDDAINKREAHIATH